MSSVSWSPFFTEWENWLRAAGIEDQVDWSRGPRFSHANIALQAAIAGQGVTLGSESVASDEVAAGRLVRPFDLRLPVNFAYYLVFPEATAGVPKVAAFRSWMQAETAGQRSTLEALVAAGQEA